jgi:hypothetical protein
MFCSTCGVSVAQGLSYCNYCGASLKSDNDDAGHSIRPEALIFGMLATFVFGSGALAVLMTVMKKTLELESGQVIAFALLPFLVILLLEVVFIRLLLARNKPRKEKREQTLSQSRPTSELDAAQGGMLSSPTSVTEGTTRAFEPVTTKRRSE